MSCGNAKIFRIAGPVGTCANSKLELPFTNLPDGTYKVQLQFLNKLIFLAVASQGGKLSIPTQGLNEDYYYEARVFDGNGELVLHQDYNVFSFQTKTIINV